MKKCFTINPFRTTEEINTYHQLLENRIYQAVEIFYPYQLDETGFNTYTTNIKSLLCYNPELVMHLPYGKDSDLCNLNEYESVVKRLKEAIVYGKMFNISKFTLHLGYVNNNDRELMITHIIKVLKDICEFSYPCNIMIENMPDIQEVGYSPEEILLIIRAINKPNLKFIFDTGHANVSEYEFDDYLHILKPYLMHIHVSDNNGLRDEHGRMGSGNINFKHLFTELKAYSELYCLEILYRTVDDLINYARDFDQLSIG